MQEPFEKEVLIALLNGNSTWHIPLSGGHKNHTPFVEWWQSSNTSQRKERHRDFTCQQNLTARKSFIRVNANRQGIPLIKCIQTLILLS